MRECGMGRATAPPVRMHQKRGAWREVESWSPRHTVSLSSHILASNTLSRRATRCGRPLGYVKAPRSKAFLFPGSPAAILGGSGS